MIIQVQTWSQVIEVYLSQLSIKTRVLPTFTTGYNKVTDGKKSGPLQRTVTGTLKH